MKPSLFNRPTGQGAQPINAKDGFFYCIGSIFKYLTKIAMWWVPSNSRLEAAPTESVSNGNLEFPDKQVFL
jgi:hypothetical protein